MSHILSDGTVIADRYRVDRYLDAGGMQEVYVAHDLVLERDVALKTPKNSSARKRFKRSAVVSARVNHPNVAKVLDYCEFDERYFLIEELISGRSLQYLIDTFFHYFDPHLILQFGHHLAKGVAASHHEKVIHRDLKPGNIMVEANEGLFSFKITDFGIAKMTEEEMATAFRGDDSLSASQTVMGAIPYMAPEAVDGPQHASEKSDIWAIGAMMYRLLAGDSMFGVGLAAIDGIKNKPIPTKLPSFTKKKQFVELTNSIFSIVKKCCEKNPDNRPTADELVGILGMECYGCFPRFLAAIREYGTGVGQTGWLKGNIFFHLHSYYGMVETIEAEAPTMYAVHHGNRAHPVLPIKSLVGEWG